MSNNASELTPLVSPEKAAKLLDVPAQTLATWRCTGRVKLPYVRVGGAVKYRLIDIETFISQNLQHAGVAP